ncbi:1-acyl-sn-glycerol-3-phosphate acyltransferase [Thalassotalea piscium]|uniref:1-acyl-sn-glycerol-3-phosphate acyltransferase n=2 Tax=Thalassotalea piscium TaxID=1230533 RepID=A0A7X0NFX6_9GAMM|nr:1-acyl-sn-glycerol-3-phosphate acyltransferase [Thalassotalea piscium]
MIKFRSDCADLINDYTHAMLNFLPAFFIGFLSFSFYTLNTIFWVLPIVICSILKALLPFKFWQKIFSYLLDHMASYWVAINTVNQKLFTNLTIDVSGVEDLNPKQWYLVICNHQSWVDIVILQRVLHGKIPFLKFFLKKELIYVPFLGIAWWALDFPFMKRYSQSFIKKNPHLKGKDIETTKKACAKFKYKPVSVMNFIEGTRFTDEKHKKQGSNYKNLLKPKAGGIGFVLSTMGDSLNKVVNVTIYYPEGKPNFIDFLCGKIKKVQVVVDTQDIDQRLLGDYVNDRSHKINFQKWVNQLWAEKDQLLEQLKNNK